MKMRKRGWIYILIGIGLYVGGILGALPLVVRGTNIPFGPVLVGLGVLLLAWDYWRARQEAREGDPPTPPP
jgi:hypothetical protein